MAEAWKRKGEKERKKKKKKSKEMVKKLTLKYINKT